jgi:uncharacterized phage protein (TIGR02218 family)
MKTLSSGFAAHIAQGVTTLAWCWKLARTDGTIMGFTDHDQDLAFDGVSYLSSSGFTASQMQSSLGLAVDNLEVAGAISAAQITEEDILAGLLDKAAIEIWRVNWTDTSQRQIVRKGTLGQVKRGQQAFQAEIRGLAQALNQPVGESFEFACDADLGDPRCTVDLTDPLLNGTGTVTAFTDSRRFTASGLGAFADAWFSGGKLTWLTGANEGRGMEVKRQGLSVSTASIELWQMMSDAVEIGDTFKITAGCDKQFATCKAKFDNVLNFRGHGLRIPGNDSITSYPSSTQPMDGGSFYGNN